MKPIPTKRRHIAAEIAAEETAVRLSKRQKAYEVPVGRDYWGNEIRETRWTWAKVPAPVSIGPDLDGPISEIASSLSADECPVSVAARLLRDHGVEINLPWTPALGVLIAEAVNLAAKELDYEFYALKPLVIDAVAEWRGVSSGWGSDGAFYLSAAGAGTVSFHDPNGEISGVSIEIASSGSWPYSWSGISRQWLAFECLADHPIRKTLALATAPKFSDHLRSVQPCLCGPVGQLP
jgi:hypothetical protein